MKNLIKTIRVSLFLIAFLSLTNFVEAQNEAKSKDEQKGVKSQISIGSCRVSKLVREGHATFNITYKFQINSKGRIVDIEKISDNYIGVKKVKSCLDEWQLNGFSKNEKFLVTLSWEYGFGWKHYSLSSLESDFLISIAFKKGTGYKYPDQFKK